MNEMKDPMIGPVRILHLEDNLPDAELVSDRLQRSGIQCEIEVVRTRLAFERAFLSGGWQLILCDYRIPGYDGGAALKFVRDRDPVLPVIMISSSLSEEEAVNCLHMGATDYVLKRSLVRLPSAIERALDLANQRNLRVEAEHRFGALLEFAPDAVVIVDSLGLIHLVNSQAEQLFCYSREEMLGQNLGILLPERYREGHGAVVQRFIESGKARKVAIPTQLFGRRKDGTEIPLEIMLSPLRTAGGAMTIAGIRDVTERLKLEAQLSRAQRMESIGAFAGNIAHDMNNALAPVLMSLELLKIPNTDHTELIRLIESGAKRGAEMLKQLLVFSKGSYVEPKPVDQVSLLGDIEQLIHHTFPGNIKFVSHVESDLRPIAGDSTQLHQVLLNLCTNARDAMPDGGELTIVAGNVEIDETYCAAIVGAKPGSHVMWRVSDTGGGIPPDLLDRVFEPFFTTKGHGKGTGLGLSIVSGIVRSHRGFVNVYSAPSSGTTFSVYLPVDQANVAATVTSDLDQPPFAGEFETLLVVDDSDGVRNAAEAVLTSLKFNALTATDGIEALALAEKHRSELRGVITDLHMPGLDGYAFVLELKKILPDIGVIVTSGNLEEEKVNDLREIGVHTFLEKPFTQKMLISALKSIIRD